MALVCPIDEFWSLQKVKNEQKNLLNYHGLLKQKITPFTSSQQSITMILGVGYRGQKNEIRRGYFFLGHKLCIFAENDNFFGSAKNFRICKQYMLNGSDFAQKSSFFRNMPIQHYNVDLKISPNAVNGFRQLNLVFNYIF